MIKLLHKIEENTHAKPKETLEFRRTKPKQGFNFVKPLIIPKEWVLGYSKLQLYNTVYNVTEGNNEFQQFIPGY